MADAFDIQVGKILTSISLEEGWCERIACMATSGYKGPGEAELRNQLRKLGVAYVETGMSDAQFKHRKAELEEQLKAASAVVPPSYEESDALLSNLEGVWEEATAEERRKLVSPLIERVYMDMDLKLVGRLLRLQRFGLESSGSRLPSWCQPAA